MIEINNAEKILKKVDNLNSNFSSSKSGNLMMTLRQRQDIKKLYTCLNCGNININKFTFNININGFTVKWLKKNPRMYKICDKCRYKELL